MTLPLNDMHIYAALSKSKIHLIRQMKLSLQNALDEYSVNY